MPEIPPTLQSKLGFIFLLFLPVLPLPTSKGMWTERWWWRASDNTIQICHFGIRMYCKLKASEKNQIPKKFSAPAPTCLEAGQGFTQRSRLPCLPEKTKVNPQRQLQSLSSWKWNHGTLLTFIFALPWPDSAFLCSIISPPIYSPLLKVLHDLDFRATWTVTCLSWGVSHLYLVNVLTNSVCFPLLRLSLQGFQLRSQKGRRQADHLSSPISYRPHVTLILQYSLSAETKSREGWKYH